MQSDCPQSPSPNISFVLLPHGVHVGYGDTGAGFAVHTFICRGTGDLILSSATGMCAVR